MNWFASCLLSKEKMLSRIFKHFLYTLRTCQIRKEKKCKSDIHFIKTMRNLWILNLRTRFSKSIQWMGIEPTTSAVLKPRHNQLDHLCTLPCRQLIDIYTLLRYWTIKIVCLIKSFNDLTSDTHNGSKEYIGVGRTQVEIITLYPKAIFYSWLIYTSSFVELISILMLFWFVSLPTRTSFLSQLSTVPTLFFCFFLRRKILRLCSFNFFRIPPIRRFLFCGLT